MDWNIRPGPIISIRNAFHGAIRNIPFLGNTLAKICLQLNSEIGDLLGSKAWEIKNCMFLQARYANVLIGYEDGYSQELAGDITNIGFYDCLFIRDPSAIGMPHLGRGTEAPFAK